MLRPAISTFRRHAQLWTKACIQARQIQRQFHGMYRRAAPSAQFPAGRPTNLLLPSAQKCLVTGAAHKMKFRHDWLYAVSLLCSVTPCPCCALWRIVLAVLCDAVSLLCSVTPCPCSALWRLVFAVLCDALSLLCSVTHCPCCALWRRVPPVLCDAVSLLCSVTPCPYCALWHRVLAGLCDAVYLLCYVTDCPCCTLWRCAMLCDALPLLSSVTPCPCGACPCYTVWRLFLAELCDAVSLWRLSLQCCVTPCLCLLRIILYYRQSHPATDAYVRPNRNVPLRAVSKQPGSLRNTNNVDTLFHFKLIVSKTACVG